jgi:hypothetical protein
MDGTKIYITTDLGAVLPYGEYEDGTVPATLEHRVVKGTRDGVVNATYYSGDLKGTAQVRVKSGKHSQIVTAVVGRTPDKVLLTVQGTSGGSGSVLPASGGSVDLTAYVYDDLDNPIANVDVIFDATNGTLASGGGRLLTAVDGTVTDVLTTDLTAEVTAKLPGSASTTPVVSLPVTVTVPGPTVLTLYPNRGDIVGGDEVRVTGEDFAFGARVLFDGFEGTPVDPTLTEETWDENQISVYSPPAPFGTADIVDIIVENPNGMFTVRESGFTYEDMSGGAP